MCRALHRGCCAFHPSEFFCFERLAVMIPSGMKVRHKRDATMFVKTVAGLRELHLQQGTALTGRRDLSAKLSVIADNGLVFGY